MNSRKPLCVTALAIGLAPLLAIPAFADDSAASIAAGGLVARRETRIVMAKEVLRISPTKVVVDYDFRNDTDQDVTTEVAFPIPPYVHSETDYPAPIASFSDFRLFVNGKRVHFNLEAKAKLNGKDVTAILAADKIDIPTFGHLKEHEGMDTRNKIPDFSRLPESEQKKLMVLGLFDSDKDALEANWTVHLQYHWTQTFPAHSTVHVRHEYSPVEGDEKMPLETFENALRGKTPSGRDESARYQREDLAVLKSFCPDSSFLRGAVKRIQSLDAQTDQIAVPQWVDFILTSANTWRQPMVDFTLIVERGKSEIENAQRLVSFCSPQNAPVTKIDADTFQVHLTNFVPKSELRIGYFDFPESKPAKSAASK